MRHATCIAAHIATRVVIVPGARGRPRSTKGKGGAPVTISGVTEDSAELRARIAIAKSVLGHAPLYRAVRKALAALEGVSLEQLATWPGDGTHEAPEGSAESLRYWHDGYDAGYAAALERDSAA